MSERVKTRHEIIEESLNKLLRLSRILREIGLIDASETIRLSAEEIRLQNHLLEINEPLNVLDTFK